MDKVYLVISNYSSESSGTIDIQDIQVFANYEDAHNYFLSKKEEIKNFNLGYNKIEEEKDYYCESVDGEYLYYHELVYVKEAIIK